MAGTRRSSSTTSTRSRARASSPATSRRCSPPACSPALRIAAAEPQLRAKLWSNVAFLRRRFAEEGVDIGKSNSQVMPVMVNNDSQGPRGGGEDPGPRPLPEPGDLPGGAEAQVAPADLGLRRPHRGGPRGGGADDRGACCARRGFVRDNPLRLPRRDQRLLRVPDRQRAAHPPAGPGAGRAPPRHEHLRRDRLRLRRERGGGVRRGRVRGASSPRSSATAGCPSRRSTPGRSRPPRRPPASTRSSAGTCRTGWRTWRSSSSAAKGRCTAKVDGRGRPRDGADVTDHSWQTVSHLYQSFQTDESGQLPGEHPLRGREERARGGDGPDRAPRQPVQQGRRRSPRSTRRPFRELWMRNGCQLFDPLVKL